MEQTAPTSERLSISGMSFQAPPGFAPDEAYLSLMAPAPAAPVRSNLILHRRRVDPSAQLVVLVAEIVAELKGSLKGLGAMVLDPFSFEDGTEGMMLTFDCEIQKLTARQIQVLRLDGDFLTSLALTIDPAAFDDPSQKKGLLACLASARPCS